MKKRILVKGPVLSQSGYGEQSRFALRALRSRSDLFEIYVLPITWGQTGWIWENTEFRRWLDERIGLTQMLSSEKKLQVDMSLQITIPNEFQKIASKDFAYTAGIESNMISPHWVENSNNMEKILVVSNHAKTGFKKTIAEATHKETGQKLQLKVNKPVDVVWENTPKYTEEEIPNFDPPTDFNFLFISQFGPRKNFKNTLKWWVEEFIDQNVGLVVKTSIKNNSIVDYEVTNNLIKDILSEYPDRKCKIYLLHGYLTGGQMTWLYRHPKIKSIINIAHGEGFGLPLFEAAREALPIITIGWSGQLDFLRHKGKNYFQDVKYEIKPIQKEAVWPGVLEAQTSWAYADQGSYKMALRRTYKNWKKAKKLALQLKPIIEDKFSDENLYNIFLKSLGVVELEKSDYVFVSDLFKDQYVGGAELSLQVLIDSCDKTKARINSSDLTHGLIDWHKDATWVFGNIAQLDDKLIEYIINKGIKYHFVEFDYKFCEYRNPLLYEFLEDEKCDYKETKKGTLIKDFVNSSVKTYFMSEAQRDIYIDSFPDVNKNKMEVLSSLFDDKFFETIDNLNNKEKTEERKKWLVLGSRSWVKGAKESEMWCKNNNLDYEVVTDLPYEQMLEKLSNSKGVCFKPTGLDTCPRFIIEAKLLGCQLELNNNVQHLNEEWFDTDDTEKIISYLKTRKQQFWSSVKSE